MSDLVSIIPAEDVAACQPWDLTDMESNKTVPAVKRQHNKRETRKKSPAPSTNKTSPSQKNSSVEAIEDVSLDSLSGDAMSADDLQKITESAEKEGYDKGYEEGIELGKKEGLEKGIEEGIESGKQQEDNRIQEAADHLNHIAESLLSPLKDEQEALEHKMVDIICELTRTMVKRELSIDSSLVLESVHQCLSVLQNKENNITLRLNSQDIETVKTSLANSDMNITFEADDSILAGGCQLENKSTAIDVSIEKQLAQLLDDFAHQRNIPEPEAIEPDAEDENIDSPDEALSETLNVRDTLSEESDEATTGDIKNVEDKE